jgi:ATP-binding cassette, subfamily B, bacterial
VTVLVFLPLVAIALTIQYAEAHIKRYRSASRQATQQVTGLIGEAFTAVQAIQVAGAETTVLNHLHRLSDQRRQRMVQDQVFTTVLHSSLENLVSLGTGLILLVAAQSGFSGSDRTLNVGDFALFVYYLAFVTDFLWFLGGFLTLTKQTEVSFERMERLINRGEEGKQGKKAKTREMIEYAPLYLPDLRGRVRALPEIVQPAQEKALEELRGVNLTYHYPESDRGITDIDLTLQRGSLTVITGRVGSGKTTLLRLVLGLLPLQSGELFWNGQCIEHPDQFFVPPQSAYVPQVPQLFSNTLRENLVLGLHQSDQELQRAIAISALDQDLGTMPEGLNTLIGSKGMRLSGGQQQRTTVARLLVRKPELLVFDDLSSALDLETEQKLWTRLFALKHPTSLLHSSTHSSHYFYSPTFLIVSHRPSVLQQADHVIVLNNGTIEAQGKPDDVRQFLI